MLLRLNDGDEVVITSRTSKKSFVIICHGDMLGLREFQNIEEKTDNGR